MSEPGALPSAPELAIPASLLFQVIVLNTASVSASSVLVFFQCILPSLVVLPWRLVSS